MMDSPYTGSYDGSWTGKCNGGFPVSGTLMFDVDMDGLVTGSFDGTDSGMLDGTVDDMGALTMAGMGALAGMCTFDGQMDDLGNATGTFSCPAVVCVGVWDVSETAP